MSTTKRTATTLAALTFAGVLATGTVGATAAFAATPSVQASYDNHISLGPYEQLSTCLRNGNRGIDEGEWDDFECEGGPGAWYIKPS